MESSQIETLSDAERFVEGCLNDFESGIADKAETMRQFAKYTGRLNQLSWNRANAAFCAGRSSMSWEEFNKSEP